MFIDGVNMGNLPLYLFFFQNGSVDANWQGATKGFVGDVAVNGILASERTSGSVPYAGTIFTNDATLGQWQQIVNQNAGQAFASFNEVARIAGLQTDLVNAIQQINGLPANPGSLPAPFNANFNGTIQSLDGLNTQNGINEVFVLNITSNFNGISTEIDITGDPGDVYILRWDTDANPNNGYQGQVKFQSGGAIVPHGGLKPTNFINVAGEIGSSGGGSNPAPPYPQGPRFNDGQGALIAGGQDFNGGGFFTGYWLTTGSPSVPGPGGLLVGPNQSLSNGIFVGGWYTLATQFSMTSGTSGVYVSPNPATESQPSITVLKEVSPDGGITFFDANTPPGPTILQGTNPVFRYTVTNTGNATLTNITLTDDKLGPITPLPTTTLAPGGFLTVTRTGTWAQGQQTNLATATGDFAGVTFTATDPANYFGQAFTPGPAIRVIKQVSPDGGITFFDADVPPGPSIIQGTNPVFRYIVTNIGNVQLTNVTLSDDKLGPITPLPTTTLNPGESFTINRTGTWAQGQQTNIATATGQFQGQVVTDANPANYIGVITPAPAIRVIKQVSPDGGITFFDADVPPGPSIVQGTNPVFRYIVTNIGNVTLTNVTLTDDKLGAITPLPTTTLTPGDSFTLDRTGTWAQGQQTNVATAAGQFQGQTVTDSNPANYVGVITPAPAITVLKEVSPDGGITFFDANIPPGPTILQGTNPVFRYTVTNTGNVTLNNVTLTDNKLGPITPLPTTTLAPGVFLTVTRTGTWAQGQQTNLATATGDFGGITLTATDPANYFGEALTPGPTIRVIKQVSPDGGVTFFDADVPPGPSIAQGTNPVFRFIVTNIGNVQLTNVTLSDDKLGPITPLPTTTLNPGESFTIDVPGTWAAGQQTNVATATGQFQGQTVTSSNPANYFGEAITPAPAIRVIKQVSADGINFFDADVPPGPTIAQGTNPVFRYIVTNIGNVTLTNVTLNDDKLGSITPLPTTTLTPGQFFTIDKVGTWAAGQQTNIATATGEFNGVPVSDTNPANYFGEAITPVPAIRVIKQVSADGINFFDADVPPGPTIAQGTNPVFRYIVTNIGNVTLTNVTLIDDKLGPITPLPTTTLAPGQFFTIDKVGTWAQGQQTNIATATGEFNGVPVSATNPANYFGEAITPAPAISVIKQVSPDGINFFDADVPPGPTIAQGTNPVFRYIVTNIGNVTLTNVTLIDDKLGSITPLPTTTLAPGQFFTIDKVGTWAQGLQTNLATATGRFGTQTVTGTNPANYTGTIVPTPAITVKKLVSPDGGQTFVDAETAPGPVIPQGTNPIFRFIVTNTGNVTLTNTTLTDTVFGTIAVPTTTLAPGQFFVIDKVGTWSPCEHMNVATVTGRNGTTTVTDSDQAHYVGLPNPTMFKQFSIEENVSIPNQKPTAEDILDANVSVVITDVHAIKTPKGTSYEGQIMTGWKLIVEGRLVQNVVYIANDHSQSVHAAEFDVPFSTFIILPEDFKQCTPLHVEGFVEDVYVKLIDGRRIFKNITLRIEAKSKC